METILDPGKYFGTLISKKQFSDFILSETLYHPYTNVPLHYHKNFYICYVLKGQYSEKYLKSKARCSQGDIVIHPGYLAHSNLFDDKGGICFNIELTGSRQTEIQSLDNFKIFDNTSGLLKSTIQKIHIEYKTCDVFSPTIIEGLLLEAIGYTARETSKTSSSYWLKKAKAIIEINNYSGISLSRIAAELNISPSHLAREFKRASGITIGEYIRNLKIKMAKEKLQNKNEDILNIALEFGFSDQSHFTKTFKKITGLTPSRYRLINRVR